MFDLFKKAATVSSITLVSRVFGVIRDGVIAFLFGAGIVSDAFFIAFRPFDLIRKMMSDGTLSISFIPLFSACAAKNRTDQAASIFLNALFWMSVVAAVLITLGLCFAPVLIQFFVPGYAHGSYGNILSSLLFKIMVPYMGIIFFVALSMSVLHAYGNFHVPAATPIILNLSIIAVAWLFSGLFSPKVIVLAAGVVLGGFFQLLFQLPSLAKLKVFNFRYFALKHAGVKNAFMGLGPSIIGAAAFQINVLVAGLAASTLDPGSVSFLNYAERLVQFPLALIASPVAAVLLPVISRKRATGKENEAKEKKIPSAVNAFEKQSGSPAAADFAIEGQWFETGLRMVFFLTIPAMAGIMALNQPIVSLLFQRGAFDGAAVQQTGRCLVFMVAGLWAVAGTRVFVSFFYALSMTRQPFTAGVISIICNLVLSQVFVHSMGVEGIGLALSLSSIAGFAWLGFSGPKGIRLLPLLVCACRAVFMSVIMYLLVRGIWQIFPVCTGMRQASGLIVSIAAGAGGYLLGAFLTRNPEMAMLVRLFFKHKESDKVIQ